MSASSIDFLSADAWLGAHVDGGGQVSFRVWAPKLKTCELVLFNEDGSKKYIAMEPAERGYFELRAPDVEAEVKADVKPGSRYLFRLDGKTEIPDPASRFQPEGPHGPSQVVAKEFDWTDANWKGRAMNQLVIYELHVGTFTPEGTFEGIETKLNHLVNLGINAIEIMPIAQFAGARNWGYDGVGLFAAQNTYGTIPSPVALKNLINKCHELGIAVILDVVYNHLGPEGNYLPQLGPYFQSKYKTPWGDALNYDGEYGDEVRRYFLQNARQWLEEFHFDGLRLDAVHAILDTSAIPFLEQLSQMRDELQTKVGRPLLLIAESEANDSRILKPREQNGLGLSGQWADDLHHIIHALLTGENFAYYKDYGTLEQMETVYKDGLLFTGQYSDARKRSHGRSYSGIERSRLVVCSQNHDQIGNRMKGERLLTITDTRKAKLAAACVFITQNIPMIFMGEEFASRDPFLYFIDHKDPELVEAVRKGRKEEFSGFSWHEDPPDPASKETFERSKLNWLRLEADPEAKEFSDYYRRLIEISKWIRREKILEDGAVSTRILAEGRVIEVKGHSGEHALQAFFSFSEKTEKVQPDRSSAKLEIILNSAEDGGLPTQKRRDLSSEKVDGGTVDVQPFTALVLATPIF